MPLKKSEEQKQIEGEISALKKQRKASKGVPKEARVAFLARSWLLRQRLMNLKVKNFFKRHELSKESVGVEEAREQAEDVKVLEQTEPSEPVAEQTQSV